MKRKPINDNILKTTYIFTLLFTILVIYVLCFVIFESKDIIDNSYNKRVDTLSNFVDKGNIYSNNMEILATTDKETGKRIYPYNDLFCHVVGSTYYGKSGLELAYNFEMLNSDINLFTKLGNEFSGNKNPGDSIVTTLDVSLQQACSLAMSNFNGAAIVMNPKNGDVLAMVSNPGYNPNDIENEWESLSQSTNGELLNRATQGLYTPGSTFKLFTLYDYLTTHKDTYKNYTFTCKGTVDFEDYSISCSGHTWHGNEDLLKSFANSCNGSFVTLAKDITSKSLLDVCNKLLFNSKLPIEIEYKKSTFLLTEEDSDFIKNQTVIGQGETLISPMHLALVMNAIANDGVLIKPRFVTARINSSNKVLEEYSSLEYASLFTKEESSTLKEFLRAVVTEGTASSLNSSAYTLYGKTGTAQIDTNGNVNSWFTGILEYNGETYTICVVAEKVNENNTPAKEITRKIIEKITNQRKVAGNGK